MTLSFMDRLAQGPLLADGAMGTMLHSRGVALDTAFDELVLTQPAVVADVHRAYIEAGAEMILANTFGANRYKLGHHGLGERVAEVNAAAVRLALPLADQGDGRGQHILGLAFLAIGNKESAEKWLSKASEQGVTDATVELAVMLGSGYKIIIPLMCAVP